VRAGHAKMVKALINNGADVNVLSHNRQSPLYIADAKGYKDISKLLTQSGAHQLDFRVPKGKMDKPKK
ncbi:ankyrin repeat domain-containing protein, partial [Kaarinaea lacus]